MLITKVRRLGNPTDKKRTPDFIVEIQAMIDNHPSKLIIAGYIGVSKFLIE